MDNTTLKVEDEEEIEDTDEENNNDISFETFIDDGKDLLTGNGGGRMIEDEEEAAPLRTKLGNSEAYMARQRRM